VAKWSSTRHVKLVSYKRHSFSSRYTRDDVLVLAKVDSAHHLLSGQATKHILERAYSIFGQQEYLRLKDISPAHIYNLRKTFIYREHAQVYVHTHGPKNTLGERRKPEPNGRPGYLRVDTDPPGRFYRWKEGCLPP
jgi:hypothetical protein